MGRYQAGGGSLIWYQMPAKALRGSLGSLGIPIHSTTIKRAGSRPLTAFGVDMDKPFETSEDKNLILYGSDGKFHFTMIDLVGTILAFL